MNIGYFEFALLVFTSFFTLINPLGVMPIFMSMTSDIESKHRSQIAIKAVIVSFISLILFAFTGQLIFKFFSITVESFKVVGGIIFFMMGYDMLQARLVRVKMETDDEIKSYANDIAITPLAIPMICGPGSITNSIVLMQDAQNLQFKFIFILVLFIVMLLTLFLLLGASKIMKFIGETGNKIMMRLMGLIVMVIAVEFFFSGLIPILQNIF